MTGRAVLPLEDGVDGNHALGTRRGARGEVEGKEGHRAGKRREELTGGFQVSILEFIFVDFASVTGQGLHCVVMASVRAVKLGESLGKL